MSTNDAEVVRAKAERVARTLHAQQVDKAGEPYLGHLARVAGRLDHLVDQAVAWLHDSIEDTSITREELDAMAGDLTPAQAVIWQNVIADVALLTKTKGMPNDVYYARIKMSPRAKRVKLADNADNSDPVRLAALDEPTRERLTAKYTKARETLTA